MLLSQTRESLRFLEGRDPIPLGRFSPTQRSALHPVQPAGTGGKPKQAGGTPGTQNPPEVVAPSACGGKKSNPRIDKFLGGKGER